jgi:hypothetical protein
MRRIARPDPSGWLLNGVWYASEAEYQRAFAKRDERRCRIMRLIERERGELLSWPGEAGPAWDDDAI